MMKIIFIHGLGQNSLSWDKTISSMEKNIEVTCPDISDMFKNNKNTYDDLYDNFSKYCEKISLPFNLCGLSLGAVLALNYAIEYPSKVKSLVLISGQYKMPKILLKLQNIIFKFMPQTTFKKMGFKKNTVIELTNSMISLNFEKNLKDISCPVLIICGEKDSANLKAAKELANNISNAEITIVEKAGHELNKEAPQKLVIILDDFYRRQRVDKNSPSK